MYKTLKITVCIVFIYQNIEKLQMVYESFEDVELVVGGSLENNVVGAQTGPTFLCIMTEQFYRTRTGDRYFFENGEDESAFSPSMIIFYTIFLNLI